MSTRIVENEHDRTDLISLIQHRALPFTCTIVKKHKRVTYEQHKLENMWHREASEELQDEPPEDKRAYCKLHFGVAIMKEASETFADQYDRIIRPLPYHQKLEIMKPPIDLPVTRLMNTKQKSRYLDMIYEHYTSQGVRLTEPQ